MAKFSVHTVPFVKKWKTKGLLNEHSFESIHQVLKVLKNELK
jgi:hypothetical protein